MAYVNDCRDLSLDSVIGFTGSVPNGLQYAPCGKYIAYPLGSVVVIKSIASGGYAFLDSKSDDDVSCVLISGDGRFLASGHETSGQTKAEAAVWDLREAARICDGDGTPADGCLVHRLRQHRGGIRALDFSSDARYLVTLGGHRRYGCLYLPRPLVALHPDLCGGDVPLEESGM